MKADREKEQAEKAARLIAPSEPSAVDVPSAPSPKGESPEEIDPETERFNQLYEEFEAAQYAQKITILRSAIEDKALDGELAFEFFNELYPHMAERGDREEFAEIVTLLQTHQPDVYAKENH